MGRELGLPENVKASIHRWYLVLGCAFLLGTAMTAAGSTALDSQNSGAIGIERHLAYLPFPHVREASNTEDILNSYSVYLNFVSTVGNNVNESSTQGLNQKFQLLKKKDRVAAARFLRGLRFEMEQYQQLKAGPRSALNSDSSVVRNWVAKYVRVWHREVDEALFRATVLAFVKR